MEKLVKEYKGQALTSSLLVAKKFNKRHADITRAISNLSCSNMFQQRNFAYVLKTRELPNGGSKEETFYTMTKDGFTFLVMGFTGKEAGRFKEDYITAFNTMEKRIRRQIPEDLPTALRAYALEVEEHKETQKKLTQAEPHITFSKVVQANDKEIDMKKVAGILNIKGFGRNKLFQFLRDKKVLMRGNIPYRVYFERGYFNVVEILVSKDKLFTQTIVTQKGLNYIIKLLRIEGLLI